MADEEPGALEGPRAGLTVTVTLSTPTRDQAKSMRSTFRSNIGLAMGSPFRGGCPSVVAEDAIRSAEPTDAPSLIPRRHDAPRRGYRGPSVRAMRQQQGSWRGGALAGQG